MVPQEKTCSFKVFFGKPGCKKGKDATLVLSLETPFNLASVTTSQVEVREISLPPPPKSKFSGVKISAKFCVLPTDKAMDIDDDTSVSMSMMTDKIDPSGFENQVPSEKSISPIPELNQMDDLPKINPYDDFVVRSKLTKVGHVFSVSSKRDYYADHKKELSFQFS
jgi:hypothetical protein